MSVCDEIRADLISVADEKYREFNGSLIPTVDREKIIGVRVPALKNLAKKYRNHLKIGEFLSDLPHFYHEENCLHGYIIAEIKDYEQAEAAVEKFCRTSITGQRATHFRRKRSQKTSQKRAKTPCAG